MLLTKRKQFFDYFVNTAKEYIFFKLRHTYTKNRAQKQVREISLIQEIKFLLQHARDNSMF